MRGCGTISYPASPSPSLWSPLSLSLSLLTGQTKPSSPSPITAADLPPLVEVSPKIPSLPTLQQLQSTLSSLLATVNAVSRPGSSPLSSGNKQPTTKLPSIKLPGGKEVRLDISVKSKEQLKPSAPQVSTKVITTKPTVSKGTSGQVVMATRTETQHKAVSSTSELPTDTSSTGKITALWSVTTPTTATSTICAASEVLKKPSCSKSAPSGEALTLRQTRLDEVSNYISQVNRNGGEKAKRSSTSPKVSVASKRKARSLTVSLTLAELETELKTVATKWRKLGRGLNQLNTTLEQISARNGNDPEKCLSAILKKWYAYSGKREGMMFKELLKVLRKDMIGERTLADSLEEKYGLSVEILTGEETTYTQVLPTLVEDVKSLHPAWFTYHQTMVTTTQTFLSQLLSA